LTKKFALFTYLFTVYFVRARHGDAKMATTRKGVWLFCLHRPQNVAVCTFGAH